MRWLDRNLPWVLLAGIVATTVILVGALAIGTLVVFGALLSGATVTAALGGAAVVLSVVAVLVTVDVALAFGLVLTVLRRASLPRSDRLAGLFRLVERLLPPVRGLGLSERFEPQLEDRERRIKRRYVEGELTEVEFEREMRRLLDREGFDPTPGELPDGRYERGGTADAAGTASTEREPERE